jgi:lipopolysaccharide/colanic/teichoic acid biosynthesis glycosyltransferase
METRKSFATLTEEQGSFASPAVQAVLGPFPERLRFSVGTALAKRRWQVAALLLFAVALPALFRWPGNLQEAAPSFKNAIYGTTAAVILAYVILRKLAAVPGLQVFGLILPIVSVCYGLMAALLLLSREDYSRFHVLASFAVAVALFYVIFLVERNVKRARLAVIAGGHIGELMESDRVEWVVWKSPEHIPRGFDGIVADLRAEIGPAWEAFLSRCALAGVPVYHSKQVQESLTGRVAIEHLSENTLGSLNPSSLYVSIKLVIDVVVAIALLPAIAAICTVAAIWIKLDSPGPIFFTQARIGYRGRTFRVYKLRTMQQGAEGAHYTEDKDPRITRVGAFLRRYRIDELPQILNILKGEMSWIGPRPESLPLAEWYERELAFYSYRHIVRPGIAGWAQVQQGNVAKPELARFKLHFDFYYIKNFSPWLDLVIALMAMRTILTGFGAR